MDTCGIILCDSGISKRHKNNINVINTSLNWEDENGHGSMIIDILRMVLPNVEIYSLKILDKNRSCNLQDLLNALKICLKIDAKIICLAVAVEDVLINSELSYIIDKLYNQGKIIISSVHNDKDFSLPAGLKNVIGVGMRKQGFLFEYNRTKNIQSILCTEGIICESIDNFYGTFMGSSYACSLLTAHVYSLIDLKGCNTFNKIEDELEKQKFDDLIFFDRFNIHKTNINQEEKTRIIEKIKIACINSEVTYKEKNFIFQIKDIKQLNKFIGALKKQGIFINKNSLFRISYLTFMETFIKYILDQEVE